MVCHAGRGVKSSFLGPPEKSTTLIHLKCINQQFNTLMYLKIQGSTFWLLKKIKNNKKTMEIDTKITPHI